MRLDYISHDKHKPPRITDIRDIKLGAAGLLGMSGMVIDLIPCNRRNKHNHMRGANLFGIVVRMLELSPLNGDPETGDSCEMHFAEGVGAYKYANGVACAIAGEAAYRETQFPLSLQDRLHSLTGIRPSEEMPSIIFGLDQEFDGFVLPPSDKGAEEGVVWDGCPLALDMIDPWSRKAIGKIVESL